MKNMVVHNLRHLLFPQLCPGCGADMMNSNDYICLNCSSSLPYTKFENIPENKTEQVFFGRVKIENATSLLYFTKGSIVQNILHKIKYQGGADLAVHFGEVLGKTIRNSDRLRAPEAIIPLPLHEKKEKIRGYNQAELLADGIGSVLGVPVLANLVKRNTNSQTQTRKHRQERWNNVENIFSVTGKSDLDRRHFLLVDDVLTTGASLEACASSILNGIKHSQITIATLAIASG